MNLEILYEDNHIIVIVKPVGVLSQADHTGNLDMLTIIKKYLKEKYSKPGDVYLGLVQRLDKNTSGIMVFAKTSKAAARLSEQIRNHKLIKNYLAIVEGKIAENGVLKNYLVKDEKIVKSFVSNKLSGKLALLDFNRLNYKDGLSLALIKLHTGRHHQIRVQFANINHPLYGDKLYGSKNNDQYYLHCYKLEFIHPVKKEAMQFENMPKGKMWDNFNKVV